MRTRSTCASPRHVRFAIVVKTLTKLGVVRPRRGSGRNEVFRESRIVFGMSTPIREGP